MVATCRATTEQASAQHPFALALRQHFETADISEAATRGLRRGYLGCVTEVDRQLGRILDALERTGLAENTVVAYTSDHGEMLGKFGMWWKCSLYEDSTRVPLIVAGPGFTAGARVKTPVSTLISKLSSSPRCGQSVRQIGREARSKLFARMIRACFVRRISWPRGSGKLLLASQGRVEADLLCGGAPATLQSRSRPQRVAESGRSAPGKGIGIRVRASPYLFTGSRERAGRGFYSETTESYSSGRVLEMSLGERPGLSHLGVTRREFIKGSAVAAALPARGPQAGAGSQAARGPTRRHPTSSLLLPTNSAGTRWGLMA